MIMVTKPDSTNDIYEITEQTDNFNLTHHFKVSVFIKASIGVSLFEFKFSIRLFSYAYTR